MKKNTGFTLIELMVAIGIMMILATIALPSFNNMLAQSNITSQANDLIGAIQYTRSEAIKRNQTVTLCRTESTTSTTCSGSGAWDNWIVILTNSGTVLRRGQSGRTTITSANLTGERLAFASTGLTSALNPTLRVCSSSATSDNVITININTAGRTNTVRSTGSCS